MTRTGRRTLAAADEGPSPPGNAPTGPHLPLSVAASDAAPFVYFDSAANYGLHNGVAQITLEARRTLSTEAGLVAERVVVAHLDERRGRDEPARRPGRPRPARRAAGGAGGALGSSIPRPSRTRRGTRARLQHGLDLPTMGRSM